MIFPTYRSVGIDLRVFKQFACVIREDIALNRKRQKAQILPLLLPYWDGPFKIKGAVDRIKGGIVPDIFGRPGSS